MWALEKTRDRGNERKRVSEGGTVEGKGTVEGRMWKTKLQMGAVIPSFGSPKGLKVAGVSVASIKCKDPFIN